MRNHAPSNADPQRALRGEELPARDTKVLAAHPPTGPEFSFIDWFGYFPYVPTALAIKECVRLKRIKELPVIGPVLDVGCGDGLFTLLAYPEVDAWGVDVSEREAARAQTSRAYKAVLCQSVTDESPRLPEKFFNTCIANCSLEHVPDIRAALSTIRRSMRTNGLFYLIVPKGNWTDTLPLKRALKAIGLREVARAYGAALDAQFAHHHLYEASEWAKLLEEAGFTNVESEPLGSDGSQAAFEASLIPSITGYITKKITGHWVVAPQTRKLYAWPVFRAVRRLAARKDMGEGAEILIACRAGAGK